MKNRLLLNKLKLKHRSTLCPPTFVILIISFRLFILERKSLQNIMSLLRSGQTNLTAPSTENQKMQLPAIQRYRPYQDNRPQLGLKNGRTLPLDTGNYAPKCYPGGHQLKIKSSSKLDFLKVANVVVFLSAKS